MPNTFISFSYAYSIIGRYPARYPTLSGDLTSSLQVLELVGRGGVIRTPDPLLPKQMRYQAAPRPDAPVVVSAKRRINARLDASADLRKAWRHAALQLSRRPLPPRHGPARAGARRLARDRARCRAADGRAPPAAGRAAGRGGG